MRNIGSTRGPVRLPPPERLRSGSQSKVRVPCCAEMHRPAFAYVIFFLSGAAALGYQIVWTRMFAIGLGHELPSMLAVVAAFFGGLAIGAWGLDRLVSRSRRPGRWYAALELLIALWAIASIVLRPQVNHLAANLIGIDPTPWRQWFVSFGIPLATLLPATASMGATFPAMERFVARLRATGALVGGKGEHQRVQRLGLLGMCDRAHCAARGRCKCRDHCSCSSLSVAGPVRRERGRRCLFIACFTSRWGCRHSVRGRLPMANALQVHFRLTRGALHCTAARRPVQRKSMTPRGRGDGTAADRLAQAASMAGRPQQPAASARVDLFPVCRA